ncbi:hypothetical protein GCM10010420_55680 [Streptomyces glaucosporus]|uniref:Uncharacterized protein n=1 Tax=Streptomyces glaucosporus TaxID=284044 RepID=A0ABP5W5X8_9ACTN
MHGPGGEEDGARDEESGQRETPGSRRGRAPVGLGDVVFRDGDEKGGAGARKVVVSAAGTVTGPPKTVDAVASVRQAGHAVPPGRPPRYGRAGTGRCRSAGRCPAADPAGTPDRETHPGRPAFRRDVKRRHTSRSPARIRWSR